MSLKVNNLCKSFSDNEILNGISFSFDETGAYIVLGESGVPHALEPADFMVEPGKRYLVNVGSVGYPRTGVCRSFYCIYDDCSRTVFFRSLPFDLEAYSEKMHGKGLDEAPWMRAREKERQGHEVRRATNFANETPRQGAGHQQRRKQISLHPRRGPDGHRHHSGLPGGH